MRIKSVNTFGNSEIIVFKMIVKNSNDRGDEFEDETCKIETRITKSCHTKKSLVYGTCLR